MMVMERILKCPLFLVYFILTSCTNCNSHLQNQTIGSLTGTTLGGYAASAIGTGSGQLVAIGTGMVVGSIVGSMIGSAIDHQNQRRCPQDTIDMTCFNAQRITITEPLCPGQVAMNLHPNPSHNSIMQDMQSHD